MNIIFLGPPGSGKGTQATLISKRLGLPRLSTGDMLRENIRKGTSLGREAKVFMFAGKLVPDILVIEMLKERLLQEDCKGGALFDGFPRTIEQARMLDEATTIDHVVNLDVADEQIVERMAGRRVCLQCSFVSHVDWLEGSTVCPQCCSDMVLRDDDQPDTVLERLRVYHLQTAPLIHHYQQKHLIRKVDGTGSVDTIAKLVFEAVS